MKSSTCIFLCLCAILKAGECGGPLDHLWRTLELTYNPALAPLPTDGGPLVITVDPQIFVILDLKEREEKLMATWALNMLWTDYRLQWIPVTADPEEAIFVRGEFLWIPEIAVLNSETDMLNDIVNLDFRAKITPQGEMTWYTAAVLQTSCEVDLSYFPFDDQWCSVQLRSWSLESDQLQLVTKSTTVSLPNYRNNTEWSLIDTEVTMDTLQEFHGRNYSGLTFHIHLRRNPDYFFLNFALPTLLMAGLSLLVFMMPAEALEKTVLAVTVLLAFTVFSTLVVDSLPKMSGPTPLLAKYVYVSMALSALSIAVTMLVMNFHFGNSTTPAPHWLLRGCRQLSKILCMHPTTVPDSAYSQHCSKQKPQQPKHAFANNHTDGRSHDHHSNSNHNNSNHSNSDQSIIPNGAALEAQSHELPPVTPRNAHVHVLSPREGEGGNNLPLEITLATLTSIEGEVRSLVSISRHVDDKDEIKEEWAFVSRIADRFLFVVFLLANLVNLLVCLVIVPLLKPTSRPNED